MKIRYYLRGLGLGILFTTVFFLIGGSSKQTMSDEMIKERAKELGMIENTVLADIGNTMDESVEESIVISEIVSTEVNTDIEVESTSEMDTETVAEETSPETEESVEETSMEEELSEVETESSSEEEILSEEEEEEEETPETGQIISIVVNKGEGSDTVSRRLYEAGLVDDPYEYDRYLMQNKYDRKIGAGEHLIPTGSSWEEIAQLLCR